MRITVDIDKETLEHAMRLTGEKKKGPAVSEAASQFVRRQMAREFGRLIAEGAFDYGSTPEENEAQDR
jgi:hypothetical protein